MFISTIINLCIFYSILFGSINCINFCGDWTQYKQTKCLKVIEKKTTEEVALKLCTELDKISTLLTIHSKDEQEFLNKMLVKHTNISPNVWIGMKYSNQMYRWMDGTDTNYTNWSDDAVKDGIDKCVQMSLVGDTLNKWTDISCKKPALVVCQKKPELNLNSVEKVIADLSEHFDNKMSLMVRNVFPLGFLYTQLPNQSSPEHLWPSVKWSDVTNQYSGLFFRAGGSGAQPFGQIQPANQSYISDIIIKSAYYSTWNGGTVTNFNLSTTIRKDGSWTHVNPFSLFDEMKIYTTTSEVRPRNTAIKIWKRV